MKGALVFLIVFFAIVLIGIPIPDSIPPGRIVYDALDIADTDYPVLGIEVTTLVIAVLNGVVWGIIVWSINSLTIAKKNMMEPEKNLT